MTRSRINSPTQIDNIDINAAVVEASLAHSFSAKFTPEQRAAMRESDMKLLDTSNITTGTDDWHAKFGEHTHSNLPPVGRPNGLNTFVSDHADAMIAGGIAQMRGLNYDRADAATVADVVLTGLDQWADELSGEPANDQPHVYERSFTVPTGAYTATGEAQIARLGIRIGKDISVSEEDAINAKTDANRARYLAYDIGSAGRSELRVIAQREADLVAVQKFDSRTGEPVMKLEGKAREIAERRLADARRSLKLVQIECALAFKLQSEHAAEVAAEETEFEEAVNGRAGEMLVEDEARKRATALAARRGR